MGKKSNTLNLHCFFTSHSVFSVRLALIQDVLMVKCMPNDHTLIWFGVLLDLDALYQQQPEELLLTKIIYQQWTLVKNCTDSSAFYFRMLDCLIWLQQLFFFTNCTPTCMAHWLFDRSSLRTPSCESGILMWADDMQWVNSLSYPEKNAGCVHSGSLKNRPRVAVSFVFLRSLLIQ